MSKRGTRHFTHGQPLPNLWAVSLLILAILSAGHQKAAAQDLQFTVTTLQDVSSAPFSTWLGPVATSLLPSNTPGAFLGTIPPDIVEATCQAVEGGQLSFQAEVTVQGNTDTHQIQIQNIGGCDASSESPQGVELVYIDENGYTTAVICDENTFNFGCQLYVTGDDVTDYYNGALSNSSTMQLKGGHRRLLVPDCFVIGAATGAVVGAVGGAGTCAAAGGFYLACLAGATILGFVGGAFEGCGIVDEAGCFPGDSLVMVKYGQYKLMSQLEIGDQVATWGENGSIKFDHIYAMGHADGDSNGVYFDITLVPNVHGPDGTIDINKKRNLQLTPGHFIPTLSGEGKVVYKRALDINVDDKVWATVSFESNFTSIFTVKEISMSIKKGLYNPFTIGGSIIVNGVVASTHSEWFLDDTFGYMGIPDHWLPLVYQVVLFPARLIYKSLPNAQYRMLYLYIDKHLDIAKFGTKHGGIVASVWFGISSLLGAPLILQLFLRGEARKGTKSSSS